jgi:hypothetical protein
VISVRCANASTASLKLQRFYSVACNWKNPAAALAPATAECNLDAKKMSFPKNSEYRSPEIRIKPNITLVNFIFLGVWGL